MGRFRNVVIVGGWRSLSQYRLFDTPGESASYPGIKEDFYKTFATLRALPCDIFLGAHGIYFDLLTKVKRMQTEGEAVFIDPKGYLAAVNEAQADFDKTVAGQTRKKIATSGLILVATSEFERDIRCGIDKQGHKLQFPSAFRQSCLSELYRAVKAIDAFNVHLTTGVAIEALPPSPVAQAS